MSSQKPRIAVYGRHSTDKQNPNSSADQVAVCGKLVEFLDGEVVGTYLDPETSGYRRDRRDLRRMLYDIRDGKIDIVVCESLDRLARDPEDISWLGKKLQFDRVQLWTVSERHVDDVKLGVAALLGSLFLSQLRQKVHRGLSAAVLAGKFAGGRAYGYRKVSGFDERGQPLTGLLEIEPSEAGVVRRIFDLFANGLSSIQIAKRLNEEGIAGPRGGAWNPSTIRGDPKKLTGILNNPLYTGELVWNRREWRKNADSDRRERLYRIRPEEEWLRNEVPDLRIIDEATWDEVRREITLRSREATKDAAPVAQRRRKHLLSGSIKCGCCGSNFTSAGKDYYRCAGARERGTCQNLVSIRRGPLEHAVLSVLQHHLLTPELAELFAHEFRKEVARLSNGADERAAKAAVRLSEVTVQIETLAHNMVLSAASPALHRLLGNLEREKAELENLPEYAPRVTGEILPHPMLLKLYQEKVADLAAALSDDSVRTQAAETIARLIDSVTIHPGAEPEAEVVAEIGKLVGFAINDNEARWGRSGGSFVSVVAGVGFEPTTFRL
ncbi:recombinase family protein [Croceibacterium ferulae]|uniref:recombinase family protein n=1 Tax=Croceibacterium ferulae TaxID=1854641 RepID=UPI000F8667D4|nr:recombinase family protein [Croceibacterium ferulae]